jgi:hypothetical protein
MAFY